MEKGVLGYFQKTFHNDKALCEGKIIITSYLQRKFPGICILIYIMLAKPFIEYHTSTCQRVVKRSFQICLSIYIAFVTLLL